ncbi:MAG: CoA transferase subunit A [Thermoleophilia bacterium]
MVDKQMTLAEAVARHVPDGSSILMGACQESVIPFAAGHEIIRQGRQNLTLLAPISDMLFDQIIGAGCVSRVQAAWIGNVSAGLGHCYRRAVEDDLPRPLEVHDYSNFAISLALLAGSLGAPFIPTRSLLGSDLPRTNPWLIPGTNPLAPDEPLILVRALRPDVIILHVQRADREGHLELFGNLGIALEGGLAAKTVIATAEEIVSTEDILADPNRILLPAHKVAAVTEEPGGAHPSPVPGYTERDHQHFHDYHVRSRSLAGFESWLKEWVLELPDRKAYMEKLEARKSLAASSEQVEEAASAG